MIDVFLRWYPQGELRRAMASAVNIRLTQMSGVRIVIPITLELDPYHIESKKYAERAALSDIYCVIDDDQLPIGDDFFVRGVEALENNPEYGMLAGFPLEYGLEGEPYANFLRSRLEVIQAHSIGCPYFVRKGTLREFPDGPLRQYDGILSKVVTDQGLKTGFARKCLYNHLGFGFSQVGTTE